MVRPIVRKIPCATCGTPVNKRKGARENQTCATCYNNERRRATPRVDKRQNHAVGGTGYNRYRPILKAKTKENGDPCVLCNGEKGPIDFEAGRYDPWSFSVHHIVDRKDGGDRDDPANMAPAHLWCNQKEGGLQIKRRRAADGIPPHGWVDTDTHIDTIPYGSSVVHTTPQADHVSDRWMV